MSNLATFAEVAALAGDLARAEMLRALMDGRTGLACEQPLQRHGDVAEPHVAVWWIDRSRLPVGRLDLMSLLTEEERMRWGRFHQPLDRERFALGRCLCRLILAPRLGCAAKDVGIRIGLNGRPVLAAATPLWFSLTHSGDLVGIAVGPSPDIGLDTEEERSGVPEELCCVVCTQEERAALAAAGPTARSTLFFELWSLKEAYMKAIDVGLGLDPKACGFDPQRLPAPRFLAEPREGKIAESVHWEFHLWRPLEHQSLALAFRPPPGAIYTLHGPFLANNLLLERLAADAR